MNRLNKFCQGLSGVLILAVRGISLVFLLLDSAWLTGLVNAQTLPPGLSRYNPVGLSRDWTYEGTAFTALKAPASGLVTTPVYRFRHPSRGYLLTLSSDPPPGFQFEGLAFHVPMAPGRVVYRFRKPSNNSYFFTLNRAEGDGAGFIYEDLAFYALSDDQADAVRPQQIDGVSIVGDVSRYQNLSLQGGLYFYSAGKESPYQAGAFYFDVYSPRYTQVIEGTRRVYGREGDWWGGVRDFYGQDPGISCDTRGWLPLDCSDWFHLKPLIGYYDVRAVATLQRQIRQASEAGLTFFSFYWYWSRARRAELLGEGLQSFIEAPNSRQMKFNLALYAHPWDPDLHISRDEGPLVVERLVDYFNVSNYLRLPDGRPVFVIGDARNIAEGDLTALNDFVSLLKLRSEQRLGVQPFVQVQPGAITVGWDSAGSTDGVSCLVPYMHARGGDTYKNMVANVDSLGYGPLRDSGRPISPCIAQNFDERPRQDILIADRSAIRYLTGKTEALLRQNVGLAKDLSDSQASHIPGKNIVYVYAWNEWHEGGIIEPHVPTAEDPTGSLDLNVVTDVFQLPRAPSACLDQGVCN